MGSPFHKINGHRILFFYFPVSSVLATIIWGEHHLTMTSFASDTHGTLTPIHGVDGVSSFLPPVTEDEDDEDGEAL